MAGKSLYRHFAVPHFLSALYWVWLMLGSILWFGFPLPLIYLPQWHQLGGGGGGGVLFFAAAHRVIAQLVPPPPRHPLPCLGYKKTFLKTGIFPHKMTLCCFMLKKQQPPFPVVLCMLLCYTCVLYGGCWKKSHTDMEGLFSSVELDLELL